MSPSHKRKNSTTHGVRVSVMSVDIRESTEVYLQPKPRYESVYGSICEQPCEVIDKKIGRVISCPHYGIGINKKERSYYYCSK